MKMALGGQFVWLEVVSLLRSNRVSLSGFYFGAHYVKKSDIP